jgi:hypothetical protein
MPIRPITLRATLAALTLLAACGGGGGGGEAAPPPPPPAPNITAAGGSVSTSDGSATLVVPAGAAGAPMTVTLASEPDSAMPADPRLVPGTVLRLGGSGGTLAADAELTLSATAAYPDVKWIRRAAPAGERKARLSDPVDNLLPSCDLNGDGVIDGLDFALTFFGYACHHPPRLVALNAGLVQQIGGCNQPLGNQAKCKIKPLDPKLVAVWFDKEAPQVAISGFDGPTSPQVLRLPGTYTLRAEASDNLGVTEVQLLRLVGDGSQTSAQLLATRTVPPFDFPLALTAADNGEFKLVVQARDQHGNVAGRGLKLVVGIDTTAPTVSLAASATSAAVGDAITLAAQALDNAGLVSRVDFYRGNTKIGEDGEAPYTLALPPFAANDIGTVSYQARVIDASDNEGVSNSVQVTVAAAAPSAVYVSPAGADTNPGTAAAPLRTLAAAFAAAGPAGTVWLQDGSYTPASEGLAGSGVFTGRVLPAGAVLRAVNPGAATIGFTLDVPAGGSLVGLNFDSSSSGRILASGGTLAVSRPQWVKLGSTNLGHGLQISGTAQVVVDPGGDPAHNYAAAGLTGFAEVTQGAALAVNGGRIDGSTGQANAFTLDGSARLVLAGVQIGNTSGAWVGGGGVVYVGGTANQVSLDQVTIDLAGAAAACVLQDRNISGAPVDATRITITGSQLRRCGGGAIQLREGTPELVINASVLADSGRWGIEAGQIGFDSAGTQYAAPTITLDDVRFTDNALGGVLLNQGGRLDGIRVQVAGPGPGAQFLGVKPYRVSLLRSQFTNTGHGLVLQGDGGSVFDLGTNVAAGDNSLRPGGTGIVVGVAAGVTVLAVGNFWRQDTQGTSAQGQYLAGSSVCGGNLPCDVSVGNGLNYTFQGAGAGAKLRLVGP